MPKLNPFTFRPVLSRFAHAGDPDDCGHEDHGGGNFAKGNTCAGEGDSKEQEVARKSPYEKLLGEKWRDKAVKGVKMHNAISDIKDFVDDYSFTRSHEIEKRLLSSKSYAEAVGKSLDILKKNVKSASEILKIDNDVKKKRLEEIESHASKGMSLESPKQNSEKDVYVNYFNKSKIKSDDPRDINKALKKIHNSPKFTSVIHGLKSKQKEDIRDYCGGEYQDINNNLRYGDSVAGDTEDKINRLHETLSKASLPEDMVVYRGISRLSDISEKFSDSNPDSLIGYKINDKAFMSTSLDMNKASSFSGGGGSAFEIKAPKGSNGISTDDLGLINTDECEFLFDKDHSIEITGWRRENINGKDRLIFECNLTKEPKQ